VMDTGRGSESWRWPVAGAILLALFLAAVWHFHVESNPAQQLAVKATRVDLVERIQLALASSSEAEKSAVLAITDQESQVFAAQARAATAEAERERQDLGGSLAVGGSARERELLSQFTSTFGVLRRVDEEVLALAVKNTNLKAYALLYGPVAEALGDMDAALSRIEARRMSDPDAPKVLPLAYGAQLAAIRIQALLSPHIAEEADSKMDQLEVTMAKEEEAARRNLAALAAMPGLATDANLAAAASSFARFGALKAQILALSRENTNVRSLSLSLNQKRKAMLLCLDSLNALHEAILEDPIPGVTYGRPQSPR
jgi:hypothetical protein